MLPLNHVVGPFRGTKIAGFEVLHMLREIEVYAASLQLSAGWAHDCRRLSVIVTEILLVRAQRISSTCTMERLNGAAVVRVGSCPLVESVEKESVSRGSRNSRYNKPLERKHHARSASQGINKSDNVDI